MNIASKRLSLLIVSVVMAASTMSPTPVSAQIQGGPDINTSLKTGDDSECAIAKNPVNPLQLFASCNSAGAGIFAARSVDGGDTWTYPDPADKTIADGDAGQGAAACCDPTLAWDTFGNLYITYLAALVGGSSPSVETLLSTDGGLTFTTIGSFAGSQDQPTIVAENTTAAGVPVAVWVVWNQNGTMQARSATATALGTVTAFNPIQNIPGTNTCSFGDVAVSPAGVVVQVCQSPNGTSTGTTNLLVNIDADGLGPGNFGAAITATATSTSGFDFIPPQNSRSVDAEAGLAYDRNPASPRFGRLYLVYTDEVVDESNDTDIRLRWSDNNGTTWSAPIRVNDDPAAPIRSQFLPRIATNPASGNITVCWHDARNSATNTSMQIFCSVATPTAATPTFIANVAVSDGASTSNGAGIEFGDYAGLTYISGGGPPGASRFQHPIWADTSNSTGNNPNTNANFEGYTNWMRGGVSTNEGDPHIRTVDGVHYDFQTAGEFVSLRGGDGFEVQTRQTAIATTFFPGENAHTGLATCVSVNSAVAAKVGKHRVTWQPRLEGVPDPSGLELRIDGVVTALSDTGIVLPQGGRVVKSAVGGLEIEFPNGSMLAATPGFWSSQGKWYINVNIYGSDAFEGVMGALARGSWLPTLPDGSTLGPRPASSAQRYADLNVKFANAWRVSKRTSLFDYAAGQSTDDFTMASWPKDKPPCDVPHETPAKPAETQVAVQACSKIIDRNRRANCVFDVTVTGEIGFAKTYLRTERLDLNGTATTLSIDKRQLTNGQPPTFTATVHKRTRGAKGSPLGAIQFVVNGKPAGKAIPLDRKAKALFAARTLDANQYRVSARFIPAKESTFLASSSPEISHPDRNNLSGYQAKPE